VVLVRNPERGDGRRNQDVLLKAATDAICDDEIAASTLHTEIARRTGLGLSTVYRHLGNRHGIAASIIADRLRVLRAAGQDVVNGQRSIRELLDLLLTTHTTMHRLSDLVLELPEREQNRYVDAIVATMTPAFDRARADGTLRAGTQPSDLRAVLAMLMAAMSEASDAHELDRVVQMLLNGLTCPDPFGPSRLP
jgi:AcrR family transcriptional regulator